MFVLIMCEALSYRKLYLTKFFLLVANFVTAPMLQSSSLLEGNALLEISKFKNKKKKKIP